MDGSKELMPVSSLIRWTWRAYLKNFDRLIWIQIVPSLILAFGDYLNIFGDPFLHVIGDAMIVVGFIFSILSGLALIYAAQNSKQFNESYQYAEGSFLRYVWLRIIWLLIIVGGLFLLVVPALIFLVWFSLAEYIFVIEGDRGMDALLKSREYFRGNFWALLWRLIIPFIISFAVTYLALSIGYIGGPSGEIAMGFIAQAVLAPFLVLYRLGLYNNVKQIHPHLSGLRVEFNRLRFTMVAFWGVIAPVLLGAVSILIAGTSFLLQSVAMK